MFLQVCTDSSCFPEPTLWYRGSPRSWFRIVQLRTLTIAKAGRSDYRQSSCSLCQLGQLEPFRTALRPAPLTHQGASGLAEHAFLHRTWVVSSSQKLSGAAAAAATVHTTAVANAADEEAAPHAVALMGVPGAPADAVCLERCRGGRKGRAAVPQQAAGVCASRGCTGCASGGDSCW